MGDIKMIRCLINMSEVLNPKTTLPPFFPLNVSGKGKIPIYEDRIYIQTVGVSVKLITAN